jgi:6-phosphogluconolactonase
MIRKVLCEFFVASCAPTGGAYRYRLYEDEMLEQVGGIPMPSPMLLQIEGDRLYAILRAPFEDSEESGVAAYDPKTGERLTEILSTKGVVACHFAVDGEDIYCANYVSGSVFQSPDKVDRHEGHGVNPQRQSSPHVHSTFLSPDKKYLLSCDLGLDTIFVYDRELNLVSTAKVPDGAGARHTVFSKDGRFVYCINEMSATVSVFAYDDGHLTYLHDVDAKPKDYTGQGAGSAIRLSGDGARLYVTERGSNTIALFSVDGASLTLIDHYSSHGNHPRDFDLIADGRYAVCTNQFENLFVLYRVGADGELIYLKSVEMAEPLSVVEVHD